MTLDTGTDTKLHQLVRCIDQHYDRQVAPTGICATQYSLLALVIDVGPFRPTDLARRMRLSPSTLSRNLGPLVSRGLLRLEPGLTGAVASSQRPATVDHSEIAAATDGKWPRPRS
jgi:DNA-binding MarR family transcriptional regulator